MNAYQQLEQHFKKHYDLEHLDAIVSWDEAAMKIFLKRITYFYCLFSLNLYAATFPQTTLSYSVGIGQPITTSTADTLEKGELGISQRAEYFSSPRLSDAVLLENPDAESQRATFNNYIMIFYGLKNNLTLGASLPYAYNYSISAARFNDETNREHVSLLGNSYGVGNTSFFTSWRFIDEKKHFASMGLLTGFNAPTGDTTAIDNNGDLFQAADQPGSGAWTPLVGITISKKFKKFSLSSNVTYTQGTEGTQKTTLGSIFDYNFATVVELYTNKQAKLHVDGIMEINGEYSAKDNIAGFIDQNSGGNSILLLPGLRLNIHTAISCYLGVNIPLVQNLYGAQVKNQYGLTGGVDFSFS